MKELLQQMKTIDLLNELWAIAEKISEEASSLYETLPPHEAYVVSGDLIRDLTVVLEQLQELEE